MTIFAKLISPSSRPEPSSKEGSTTYRAVAEAVGTLRQYQDVPIRFQRQWITAFLAGIILIGITAGLYLSVTSRTAITGREVQSLQRDITINQRANADLETQIAGLLSSTSLESRAEAAGYTTLEGANLDYMVVPGYFPPEGLKLSPPQASQDDVSLSPEYTESLFTWLNQQLEAASLPLPQDH